jgi:hypothetical protein
LLCRRKSDRMSVFNKVVQQHRNERFNRGMMPPSSRIRLPHSPLISCVRCYIDTD